MAGLFALTVMALFAAPASALEVDVKAEYQAKFRGTQDTTVTDIGEQSPDPSFPTFTWNDTAQFHAAWGSKGSVNLTYVRFEHKGVTHRLFVDSTRKIPIRFTSLTVDDQVRHTCKGGGEGAEFFCDDQNTDNSNYHCEVAQPSGIKPYVEPYVDQGINPLDIGSTEPYIANQMPGQLAIVTPATAAPRLYDECNTGTYSDGSTPRRSRAFADWEYRFLIAESSPYKSKDLGTLGSLNDEVVVFGSRFVNYFDSDIGSGDVDIQGTVNWKLTLTLQDRCTDCKADI